MTAAESVDLIPVALDNASTAVRTGGWNLITEANPAPKDREILLGGRWQPFDILPGGEWATILVRWGSLSSAANAEQCFLGAGFFRADDYNVNWTHWHEVPEAPADA